MSNTKKYTEEELFEIARNRFLESSRLTPAQIEEMVEFNRELHTLSIEELFKIIRK